MAKPLFTIAISGCSSAGKSTLAFLLSEIFSDVEVDLNSKSLLSLFISVGWVLLFAICWVVDVQIECWTLRPAMVVLAVAFHLGFGFIIPIYNWTFRVPILGFSVFLSLFNLPVFSWTFKIPFSRFPPPLFHCSHLSWNI